MLNNSPIALFIYNRPDHTSRTLEALMKNAGADESHLFVFADGAKIDANAEDLKKIAETRSVVNSKRWCGKVTIFESEVNKGLAASVIEGVSKIVDEHGRIIVLEDDLVTSPYFLSFMNDALNVYEQKNEVACISGYIYPVKARLPETFFIKGADCWGWATWKRSWDLFEADGNKLLCELREKEQTTAFDFNDSYPYTKMLEDQVDRKNQSWAIRWYASAFLKNKYCLYPGVSLVQNIGIDGSGTHSGVSDKWQVNLATKRIVVDVIPVKENALAKQSMIDYFKSIRQISPGMIVKILRKLNSILKR